MVRVYEEIVDFIAAGTTPEGVAQFQASEATKQRVEQLVAKEKSVGLTPEEASNLNHYLELEHLMRLAKARAQGNLGDDHVRQR